MDEHLKQYRSLVEELAKGDKILTKEEFEMHLINISEDQYQVFKNVLDHLWNLYLELKKIF